jgi:hypothetical protein
MVTLAIAVLLAACTFAVGAIEPSVLAATPAGFQAGVSLGLRACQAGLLLLAALAASFRHWSTPLRTGEPRRLEPLTQPDYLLALGLTLAALAVRIPGLNSSLWWDELGTLYRVVHRGWLVLLAFNAEGTNHILNSTLIKVTTGTLGEHEWLVRLPAFLFSLATPVVVFLALRKTLGRGPSAVVGLILAFQVSAVLQATNARGYAGGLFWICIATSLLGALCRDPTPRRAIAYVVSGVLATGFMAFSLVPLSAHGALGAIGWLVQRRRRPEVALRMRLIGWLALVVLGLSLAAFGIQFGQIVECGSAGQCRLLQHSEPWQLVEFATGAHGHLLSASLLLASLGGLIVGLRRGAVGPWIWSLPLLSGLVSLMVPGAPATPRLLFYVIPSFAVGLGAVVASIPDRRKFLRLAVSLGTLGAVLAGGAPSLARWWRLGNPDLRGLARELVSVPVVLTGPQAEYNVYYFPDARVATAEAQVLSFMAGRGASGCVVAGTFRPLELSAGFQAAGLRWVRTLESADSSRTSYQLYCSPSVLTR